uniref:Uncharacterized protein n=1 Tax=Helianthus annuus TaxID=4232 RepID=A0A251UM33_HELAN
MRQILAKGKTTCCGILAKDARKTAKGKVPVSNQEPVNSHNLLPQNIYYFKRFCFIHLRRFFDTCNNSDLCFTLKFCIFVLFWLTSQQLVV